MAVPAPRWFHPSGETALPADMPLHEALGNDFERSLPPTKPTSSGSAPPARHSEPSSLDAKDPK
jgi:hypothetical protein